MAESKRGASIVRPFTDADRKLVHTLFVNGMKDNMNALILEAIKHVPGKGIDEHMNSTCTCAHSQLCMCI